MRCYHFTHLYHKSTSYDVWFLRFKVQRTKHFVILGHFLLINPPSKPKRDSGDIIILHKTIINENYIMFDWWDMVYHKNFGPLFLYPKLGSYALLFLRYARDRWNCFYFLFWVFILLPVLQSKKRKFQESNNNNNNKKILGISSFYTIIPKILIICYTVFEVWYLMNVIAIFRFGLCFALLPSNSSKNKKFQKNVKKPGDIIVLHKRAKNHYYPMRYCSWDIFHDRNNCYFSFCPLTTENIKN